MNIAVIGSREFNNEKLMFSTLDQFDICKLISGGARGADTLAEKYAYENSIITEIFYPDWNRFGRGAGFIRNKEIIENCDMVVAFWDGKSKGTLSSIQLATKALKEVLIIPFSRD